MCGTFWLAAVERGDMVGGGLRPKEQHPLPPSTPHSPKDPPEQDPQMGRG